MRGSPFRLTLLLAVGMSAGAVIAACGSTGGQGSTFDGGGDATGDGSSVDVKGGRDVINLIDHSGGDGTGPKTVDADFPCDGCAPFPPSSAPTCKPSTLGPPSLVYPPDGVLLPPNMNVLEVQWLPPKTGKATLYEVDFANKVTDVKVETPCLEITSVRGVANAGCGLTLSQAQWNDIAKINADGDPLKITVRATTAKKSCVTASPETVSIDFAKENLTGGIYYWQSAKSVAGPDGGMGATAGKSGGIYYHDFGTFVATPTPFWTATATGRCVGCHTLSKDGVMMSVLDDDPDADDEYGDVKTASLLVATRTEVGANNVSPGFQTFTHDHKYMIATTYKGVMGMMGGMVPNANFATWTSDGNTVFKVNALPSGMQGTQPNLSNDDKTVVFVSPTYGTISNMMGQPGDDHFLGGSLWQASFDETTGAMSGYSAFLTSSGMENFYYPDQSVDGNWVVFNENNDTSAANNDGDAFYSRQANVKVMHFPPKAGDVPLSLDKLNVANGLSNSWPRWSPVVQSYKGHQILWVTFSSNRDYGLHLKNGTPGCTRGTTNCFDNYYPPESPTYDQPQPGGKMGVTFDDYAAPQIWMAAIIVDKDRTLDKTDRSYPAFWLPFQDVTAHNHSAQWVATVQSGPPGGDGGTGSDGGGSCGETGAACGAKGDGPCCADVVCCEGKCESIATCSPPK